MNLDKTQLNYNRNYQLMIMVDKFYYLTLEYIKNFNFSKSGEKNSTHETRQPNQFINNNDMNMNLYSCQQNYVSLINSILEEMSLMEGSNFYNTQKYIFTIIADNCFLKYSPSALIPFWTKNSLEKNLFNTVTGAYIIKNRLQQVLQNNDNLPDFILYSYLIALDSFNLDSEYFVTERSWILNNLNKSTVYEGTLYKDNYPLLKEKPKEENSLLNIFLFYFLIITLFIFALIFLKKFLWNKVISFLPNSI